MLFNYAEVNQEPFKYRHILHYRMIIRHNLRVKKSKHDMNRNPDWRLSYFTYVPGPTLQPLNGNPPVAGWGKLNVWGDWDGYGKFTNYPVVIFSDKLSVFTLGWNVPGLYICNRSWLILVYQSIQYLIWKSTIQFPVKPKNPISINFFFSSLANSIPVRFRSSPMIPWSFDEYLYPWWLICLPNPVKPCR